MPTHKFRSKEAYRKWNAYTHMHGIRTHVKTAIIAGHKHSVKHSRGRRDKRR